MVYYVPPAAPTLPREKNLFIHSIWQYPEDQGKKTVSVGKVHWPDEEKAFEEARNGGPRVGQKGAEEAEMRSPSER